MLVVFLFYNIAFIAALLIIRKESPLYATTILVLMLSFLGHIVGTYYYSLKPSDSTVLYFPSATSHFYALGGDAVKNMVWYVRYFLTGDSLLATFYFFSSFAFIGGVLWYTVYLRCAKRLCILNSSLTWPSLILMCWPSALVFTTGMGKDSLCFFFTPLALLSYFNLLEKRMIVFNIAILVFSLFMLTALRPYLLMVVFISFSLYYFKKSRNISLVNILCMIVVLALALFVTQWVLNTQGHFQNIDLTSIVKRASYQQDMQAQGTHFEMSFENPFLRLLFLPYSFFMNLCFPLFYLAKNTEGYVVSVENAVLVFLLWRSLKLRKLIRQLFLQDPSLKLLLYFFIVGMALMSFLNTNLGLAVRQKTMYLPAFLVIYCLLYAKTKNTHI
ncbi:MAG: hypothetical protein V4496_01660 [Pseudomonadota bacterium]